MLLYRQGVYVLGARLKRPEDGSPALRDGAPLVLFAAERFLEAEYLRHVGFGKPVGFDVRSYVHGAFGIHLGDANTSHAVVIDFAKEKVTYVEGRLWHPTQTLEPLANGGLRLRFACPDLSPVVSWVLSWGPHATVIAPTELRERVRDEVEGALANYDLRA